MVLSDDDDAEHTTLRCSLTILCLGQIHPGSVCWAALIQAIARIKILSSYTLSFSMSRRNLLELPLDLMPCSMMIFLSYLKMHFSYVKLNILIVVEYST